MRQSATRRVRHLALERVARLGRRDRVVRAAADEHRRRHRVRCRRLRRAEAGVEPDRGAQVGAVTCELECHRAAEAVPDRRDPCRGRPPAAPAGRRDRPGRGDASWPASPMSSPRRAIAVLERRLHATALVVERERHAAEAREADRPPLHVLVEPRALVTDEHRGTRPGRGTRRARAGRRTACRRPRTGRLRSSSRSGYRCAVRGRREDARSACRRELPARDARRVVEHVAERADLVRREVIDQAPTHGLHVGRRGRLELGQARRR